MPIGIKFPFKETDSGGLFAYTTITEQAVRSNLIAFLTLRKGQRPMHNDLYSPIYDFIFDNYDDIFIDSLKTQLKNKLNRYFPEMVLSDVVFNFNESNNYLEIRILYSVPELLINDSVEIGVQLENNNS